MAWTYLLLAGLLEIGFTTALQFTKGAKTWWPEIGFLVCAIASFYFLQKSLDGIPLGTAYAVLTGIGAAGTALVGIVFFNEPATAVRLALLLLLIGLIVGLKLTH